MQSVCLWYVTGHNRKLVSCHNNGKSFSGVKQEVVFDVCTGQVPVRQPNWNSKHLIKAAFVWSGLCQCAGMSSRLSNIWFRFEPESSNQSTGAFQLRENRFIYIGNDSIRSKNTYLFECHGSRSVQVFHQNHKNNVALLLVFCSGWRNILIIF